MANKLLLILGFSLISLFGISQNNDGYYSKNQLRYDNYVYKDYIKSVKLNKLGMEISKPFIRLNSNEQLRLRFDDLNTYERNYSYSITLCDFNWREVDLMKMEYMQGMEVNYIQDYKYSYNTTTNYIHYNLVFPNENIQLKKSGNYLLKVFFDDNPDSLIITQRFYVYEDLLPIDAEVIMSRDPMYRNFKQELKININTQANPLPNVYIDFKMKVMQNGRKDNEIIKTQPSNFSNNIISFKNPGDIEFYAGNEFRNFDTRRLKTLSNRIRNIEYKNNGYQVYLIPDPVRLNRNYKSYSDINGQFSIINNDNTIRSYDIEADYTNVHFTLPVDFPYTNGSVYILGELNNWNLDKRVQMEYDHEKKAYTKTLMLKQGFYNFQYLFVPNNQTKGEIMKLEGSHSETENTYHIFVYYKSQGDFYDRLIGLRSVNSQQAR